MPCFVSACWDMAVSYTHLLKQIEKELKENVRLRVSTAETFENTAENPELILESSWDLSRVNREKQGVYKVKMCIRDRCYSYSHNLFVSFRSFRN